MSKYTIDDLALMTKLSTRTIRNYINLGILTGTKEDNKWYFSDEDCLIFFENDMVKHSIEAKALGVVLDGFNIDNNRTTAIIYTDKSKLDFKLLNEKLKEYDGFDFKMDCKNERTRIIISGSLEVVTDLLNFINDKLNK